MVKLGWKKWTWGSKLADCGGKFLVEMQWQNGGYKVAKLKIGWPNGEVVNGENGVA